MQAVRLPSQELQEQGRKGRREEEVGEQIRGPNKQGEVKEVRRQEMVEEGTRCFRCGKQGHKKWECPWKKESRKEEVALPRTVWEKVKRHSGAKGLPPRGVAMCMER